MTSQSVIQRINSLSQRVLNGDTSITDEELAEAITALRSDRGVAAKSSPTTKKKAAAASIPMDLNALFNKPKQEEPSPATEQKPIDFGDL